MPTCLLRVKCTTNKNNIDKTRPILTLDTFLDSQDNLSALNTVTYSRLGFFFYHIDGKGE